MINGPKIDAPPCLLNADLRLAATVAISRPAVFMRDLGVAAARVLNIRYLEAQAEATE